VSNHKPQDCASASRRYFEDYPESKNENQNAWDSFTTRGQWQGKIWHGELCSNACIAARAPYAWVDAKANGDKGPDLDDDDFFEVDLPFPFDFYNQLKTKVKISSNGYLTFSGEHYAYGNTRTIPNGLVPNDMIAPYWTDFDPAVGGGAKGSGGAVYTQHSTGADACPYGIASGEVCCAATCGACGGSGCQARPGVSPPTPLTTLLRFYTSP
jgi:hypothetical protein